MTEPAARATQDSHPKGKITQGSGDVYINGFPAARVGDQVNHGDGTETIATGSGTVFIDGQPAARKNDKVDCQEVINSACSPSVFIGG